MIERRGIPILNGTAFLASGRGSGKSMRMIESLFEEMGGQEMRLFDADEIIRNVDGLEVEGGSLRARGIARKVINHIADWLREQPTIDPETLPIVRELREKLSRYEKAEQEGRLAFLNEPMIPTVRSDDPMDTDVYCPACGHDLSGGWEESPADEYRRMYQCPKCGQSINDMDCISKEEAEAALKERGTE